MTDVTPVSGWLADDHRRKRLRLGFLVLTIVSALVLGTVVYSRHYVNSAVDKLHNNTLGSGVQPDVTGAAGKPTTKQGHLTKKPPTGQPFTMLILGVDSRTGTTGMGTNADACHCSDTIMLARINPQTHKASLLSIPRDSRVFITNRGVTEKINSAYGAGGADNTVATIEKDLNIPINHWVVVDLAGFKSIVDAIGGIKMNFPYEIRDKNAGLYITKTGCQSVNGDTALAISRSRELQYLDPKNGQYVFDNSYEYGRSRREQILMRVIAAHTVKKSLGNPLTAKSVIDTFTSHDRMAVDQTVTGSELINLAGDFAGFNASTMQTFTLPTYTKSLYDPILKLPQDYEILEQEKDVATITAWYDAVQPTPKTSSPAPTTTKSGGSATTTAPTTTTTAPTAGATTATVVPPVTTSGAAPTTGSSASPTVTANTPFPWDPVPCS